MSTQIEFKWKPGELESLFVRKVQNGWTIRVLANEDCYDYVFALRSGVSLHVDECLAWDNAPTEEATAEPAPVAAAASPAYPSKFVRFEVAAGEVRAVFCELKTEQSYSLSQLAVRIDRLKLSYPAADELAKWETVLAQLRTASDE